MILVFSGTKDGRNLIDKLLAEGEEIISCTATSYGSSLIEDHPGIVQKYGEPMDQGEMEDLIKRHRPNRIMDATHPYAVVVSENIRKAALACSIPLEVVVRESLVDKYREQVEIVGSYKKAARAIETAQGKVLLTIGSRHLEHFKALNNKEHLYLRVLPASDVIEKCEAMGFKPCQIIAVQGPHSRKMNEVLFEDYEIATLVTKDTGSIGGFEEKVIPAIERGIRVLVVARN